MVKEVRSIMGSSIPRVRYNSASRSFLSSFTSSPSTSQPFNTPIPRRPKRKKKMSYALENYVHGNKKIVKDCCTFQKKLVVFGFMGDDSPSHFTRKDKFIVMRGLLPEIPVDSSEERVRQEVGDLIRSCNEYDLGLCGEKDFEFIDMNGKQASVPNFKKGYKFTGKAVKNLAGSGCVYVRLTTDPLTLCLSSDASGDESNSLPDISVTKRKPPRKEQREEDVVVVISDATEDSHPNLSPNPSQSPAGPPSPSSQSPAGPPSPSSGLQLICGDFNNLTEIFPHSYMPGEY